MAAAPPENRMILLAERPAGRLEAGHFRTVTGAMPRPGPHEVLCRTILLSLDPANRAWMKGRTYRDQQEEGEVMSGFTLSEVVDANGTALPVGTVVAGEGGWQEYAALPVSGIEPVTVHGPLSHHMSVLGITGLTAYFGLLEVGRPAPGETVVVSAAAGATGNVVGQLARIHGARVVGISGSDEKNRVLAEELGFDATVNHRSPDLRADLKAACPDGVDVYFDNVAGPVLDAVLPRMNDFGRIVCCGAVSGYDGSDAPVGPPAVPGLVITRRLRMEGFIVLDHAARFDEAATQLARWIQEGRLRVLEDIVDGLEAAPEALVGLLAGENVGKRMVRVGADPAT
jgi:NADPH-dependent curcumin reductase CurA